MLRTAATAIVLAMLSAPLHAQSGDWETHEEIGDVAFLAGNALLGGLTAGVLQEIRGGSFREGFAVGSLGGAIGYGGRRIAAQQFTGAGLIGRQVAAVGTSLVRNSGARVPALSHLVFPLGPVLLDVRTAGAIRVGARIDVGTSGWLLAAIADDRLDFRMRESLSAGAPVFHASRHRITGSNGVALGRAYRGLILLGADGSPHQDRVLAHERVHVLQHDFIRELWGSPAERAVLARLPGGPLLLRYADLNFAGGLMQFAFTRAFGWDWGERPWEIEAEFLEGR